MEHLRRAMGHHFEHTVFNDFPKFQHSGYESTLPDFLWRGVRIEAKTGNATCGLRINAKQLRDFSSLEDPVLYLLSYHTSIADPDIIEDLDIPEAMMVLPRHVSFVGAYFVSLDIIQRISDARGTHRQRDDPRKFVVIAEDLQRIIDNKRFTHNYVRTNASSYYGIPEQSIIGRPPLQNDRSIPYGYVVSKRQEELVDVIRRLEI